MLFTRQMAMLLRAGAGVVPAMVAIRREMTKPAHRAMIDHLIYDLEEGCRLSDALRRHPGTFDPVYCAVVAAGEASATLTEMFERQAIIVGRRQAMRNKVLAAMAYPILLTVLCSGIVSSLLFFVMPRFGAMFEQLGAEVPASTQFMLDLGQWCQGNWPLLIATPAVLITAIVVVSRQPVGKQWLSDLQLRVPVLGYLRKRLIEAQMLRTMGMLLESKVGVLETLDLAREVTRSRLFQRLFDNMETAITSGGQLSAAVEHSSLVQSSVAQAIKTGEESGNLGGALSYCADVLDEGNSELIGAVTKLIEPVILIGMGAVVGTVAVSLFMPLFDMTSAMH